MKKILFVLSAVILGCVACFAQDEPQPSNQSVVMSQTFQGRVQSVDKSDPTEGSKTEITVANEQGQVMRFVVSVGIGVSTKEDQFMPFNKVKQGDMVVVEYAITKGGVVRALTIKVK